MAAKVLYRQGTKNTFLGLTERLPNALYFCTDSKELYKGDDLYTDGIRFVADADALPTLATAADGVIYYCNDTGIGRVVNSTRTAWRIVLHGVDNTTVQYDDHGLLAVKAVPTDKITGFDDAVQKIANDTLANAGVVGDDQFKQLSNDLTNLKGKVGEIPEGATASTVISYVDEKFNAVPEPTGYAVEVETTTPDGVAKRYTITQEATGLNVSIDIPKDMVVQSGAVETKTETGDWGEPGTYLHLILANAENTNIYINVGDLIEYVKGGVAADGIITTTVAINESGEHILTATIGDGKITLAKLDADVQAAIGKAHEHANKTELDKIEDGDKAKWDTAAGKAHEHANKAELDKIEVGDKAKWDAMEQNAKDYCDTQLQWIDF